MDTKKTIILLSLSIVIVIIATASVTFAFLSFNAKQSEVNVLNSACFNVAFTGENRINYIGYPMTKETAFAKLTPYKFTITNTCEDATDTSYQVMLNIINSTSPDLIPYIRYSVDGTSSNPLGNPTTLPNNLISKDNTVTASYIIADGIIDSITKSGTYELYLWIDESAGNDIMESTFEAQVSVYSEPK